MKSMTLLLITRQVSMQATGCTIHLLLLYALALSSPVSHCQDVEKEPRSVPFIRVCGQCLIMITVHSFVVDLNRLLGFALNVSIQPIFAMLLMMYVAAAAGIERE